MGTQTYYLLMIGGERLRYAGLVGKRTGKQSRERMLSLRVQHVYSATACAHVKYVYKEAYQLAFRDYNYQLGNNDH